MKRSRKQLSEPKSDKELARLEGLFAQIAQERRQGARLGENRGHEKPESERC